MPKFRKKPVTIEAIQWNGQPPQAVADAFGIMNKGFYLPHWYRDDMPPPKLQIATLEGTMDASHGDWLIRGVQGEIYPCKPDIFAATYEAVAE